MITFNNFTFTEPIPLTQWNPPNQAGVYVILVPDSTASPKPFRAIYFGEAGNFAERGFPSSHHKYSRWVNECGTSSRIFVATYPMPNSTPEGRRSVEAKLCASYNPSCNG
jgi:hypothetical protein